MRFLFLGRKAVAAEALRYLHNAGHEAIVVAQPDDVLWETAEHLKIAAVTEDNIYRGELGGIDAVISFLYWKKIREPLLSCAKIGAFNFHSAPLPQSRGRGGINFAILEDRKTYGSSIHWMDATFDTGDLVEVKHFPLAPEETALSLERKAQALLLDMFKSFIARLDCGETIPRHPQGAGGPTITTQDMLDAMEVRIGDSPELTARRVRAFWYPPRTGAMLMVNGKKYTLVDEVTLKSL